MPMSHSVILAPIVLSLVVAGCGSDAAPTTTTPASPPAEQGAVENRGVEDKAPSEGGAKQRASGTKIVTAKSQYGLILFGPGRRAIYLFDTETSGSSRCYGACAEAWPPVLTKGGPGAGDGVEAKLLGTTERNDGTTQVTYHGHPLYYYVDDRPGEVLCHNVEEFGGRWLVVEPSGNSVS
jgi:predicted lipoprotein with Yx(FWY)xxD motif